ncbi:MAG: DUF6580 family putative transport protein [Pseudomonadota bacterium]
MKKSVVFIATLIHLLPHPFGMSPIGALALYSGAHGPKPLAWSVPLVPLTIAALITGFYDPRVMICVFGGFCLATFAGRWLLRKQRSFARYGAAVALGAMVFFLLSNFGMWLYGTYPPTLAGLLACYIAGLPFLLQALVADAAYSLVLFGLHEVLERGHEDEVVPA